ncbi:hypothetical protein D1BOALGB6SA_10256 [Olavius sp. associated proteobacterium Delta 1]|nr:hypothetical protein D1BOALGB6SA_10256 [Olavius sp. associated proteobacterium Delta 1]
MRATIRPELMVVSKARRAGLKFSIENSQSLQNSENIPIQLIS